MRRCRQRKLKSPTIKQNSIGVRVSNYGLREVSGQAQTTTKNREVQQIEMAGARRNTSPA